MADKITWNSTEEGPGQKHLETELISLDGTFVYYYFFFVLNVPLLKILDGQQRSRGRVWQRARSSAGWSGSMTHTCKTPRPSQTLSMSWYSVSDDDEDDKD